MPYALREFQCPDCPAKVSRRKAPDAVVRCVPCAVRLSAEVQRQLHEHVGPYYEKWAWRNAAAARLQIGKPAVRRASSAA